ncbi:phosphoribosylamine--glycine ligase [Lutibaculum baratangense]|uniref:Phosphoribosylamine--glycine ligase n=1 Tax=Lutibaculum baratangense AMV1 TaxID=631454 RepID=V4RFN9_9HYPH|nr:phosphoribosylamine--glycine ligase [Lutibaculum baratangense]ESR24961.1 Phosphoribosylamine--glycine ligase [Lutibaculum baratangense AMV1]
MKVLLIGSGGREHALAWALAASPLLQRLYAAPGNAGIAEVAECVDLNVGDHEAVTAFCREQGIELVVVGPEAPLVAGLVDHLEAAGVRAFGPSRLAAQLEGSKAFTKGICDRHGIPTARYGRFSDAAEATAYLDRVGLPCVVKADGLAAGKGVIIAETRGEAESAIASLLEISDEIVIEEFLTGEEASFFCVSDGETVVPLATAQDHKRAFDGDTGPNTGGMGAYSPAPVLTPELCERVLKEIVEPTIRGMAAEGMPFRGILYAGLMIDESGPKLLEYNTRFGDPEAQALMMRLKDDLLLIILAALDRTLDRISIRWRDEVALTVVMAMRGYPGAYDTGSEIRGLDEAGEDQDVMIFHAATERTPDGRLVATGGRVLGVTALGKTVEEARSRAYAAIDRIDWPEGYCRRDIGWRALARLVDERPEEDD